MQIQLGKQTRNFQLNEPGVFFVSAVSYSVEHSLKEE